MDISKLSALGLTKAESVIYSSVLKLGTCNVRDISKDCGFHRTNIYDVLEQLKEKGLVSFHNEGKIVFYKATNPSTLYGLLDEKKEILDELFPKINELYKNKFEPISVEVYKGREGMKSVFRDMLHSSEDLFAFGVKGQLREKLPIFASQWQNELAKRKMKYYGIYTEKNLPEYYTEIRVVGKELSSPVATFIYGDKININIWEPDLVAITIKSSLVANMYKQHFDLLWKIARKV
jgi:sugar-specific transcriptional regulator TrmB